MTQENQPAPSVTAPQAQEQPQPQQETAKPATKPEPSGPSFTGRLPIGEEMDSAKWTLPPPKVLGAGALVFVVLLVLVWALLGRAKPAASGTIDNVAVASPANNQVLVAINVSFSNALKDKPIWLRSASARMTRPDGQQLTDTAAAIVNFDRYFQAFPELKEHAIEPLRPDIKLNPGERASGMIIVSFPVDKQTFAQRKDLAVILNPYDQPPVAIGGKQ